MGDIILGSAILPFGNPRAGEGRRGPTGAHLDLGVRRPRGSRGLEELPDASRKGYSFLGRPEMGSFLKGKPQWLLVSLDI